MRNSQAPMASRDNSRTIDRCERIEGRIDDCSIEEHACRAGSQEAVQIAREN